LTSFFRPYRFLSGEYPSKPTIVGMISIQITKPNSQSKGEKDMCKDCDCHEGEVCSCDCGCECCGNGTYFKRRYQTKAEQITELEAYLSELKTEVQAVEEHLADLRK
jgi:hypothetical protein